MMNNLEFRALMNLLMCSDPWPTANWEDEEHLKGLANYEAAKRGFENWIIAYHDF